MVNIILSSIFDSDAILEKLKLNHRKNSKHLLIVPDNFTLAYEKAALEYLQLPGSFDLEVSDFEHLADQFLDKKALRLLDKQSGVMLLRKIIEENKADLRCFKGATNLIGFAEEMYDAIIQIRESGVEADSLIKITQDDERLTAKLKNKTYDIALLYKKYVEAIQNGCIDSTSKLKLLATLIPDSVLSEYNIYVSDYSFLNKHELNVISQLMKYAVSFNICLLYSHAPNGYIYPNSLKQTIENLAYEAEQSVLVEEYRPMLKGDFFYFAGNLFSYRKVKMPSLQGHVAINVAKTMEDEVKDVARQINEMIRKGARYKDISLVCCDLNIYQDIIKRVFEEFDISYYMDIKANLINQAFTNTILSAIKVIFSHFSEKEVRAYAKQQLLNISYKEACIFENFVLEYGIDYNNFLKPFDNKNCLDENLYKIAEQVRRYLVTSLEPFMGKIETIKDAVEATKKYIILNSLQEKNKKLSEKQEENGFEVESKITTQCYEKIDKILDQANAIMADTKTNLKVYYNILQSVIASTEISCVPIYVDCVFIGDESSAKYEKTDYIFVIGASEGKLPTQSNDVGIIADREIEAWNKFDIKIEPDTKARNRKQKLKTLQTLLKAQERLIISYSRTDASMQPQSPSETIDLLTKICGSPNKEVGEINSSFTKKDYYKLISVKNNVLEEFLTLVKKIRDKELENNKIVQEILNTLYSILCVKYGEHFIEHILSGGNEKQEKLDKDYGFVWNYNNTSPSQIEKYFNCPFKHYMDYFLRAHRREQANLEVSDIGTILHAIMEKYFSKEDACDIDNDEIVKRVYSIFKEIAKEDIKVQIMLSKPDGAVVKENLCSRAIFLIQELVAKMQCTKFRPVACEQEFGKNSEKSLKGVAIKAKNRTINIRGVIDRVDRISEEDKRFFVIDYKSKGSIKFNPANIMFGDRVQLIIYLMALVNSKMLTPAGMFYMLMPDKFEKKESASAKSRYKFIGYVDASKTNIEDIDKFIAGSSSKSSELFSIKTNKEGDIVGDILSEENLMSLIDYVKKLISNAVDEIDSGYISPRPLCDSVDDFASGACTYCEYRNICGIEEKPENKRVLDKISIDMMKNIIGGQDERD